MHAPIIKSATRVHEHVLGPNHTAVLLTDIEHEPSHSELAYAHLLVVFDRRRHDPIAFISSEPLFPLQSVSSAPRPEDVTRTAEQSLHLLCAILPSGRRSFGASEDWANVVTFERAALSLLERLDITPLAVTRSP